MNISSDYLSKFKVSNKLDDFLLAEEIYFWSGKSLKFGMLRNLIKRKGLRFIRECFLNVQKSAAREKEKLFLWLVGQTKIKYN
jgi:hypothetical protein